MKRALIDMLQGMSVAMTFMVCMFVATCIVGFLVAYCGAPKVFLGLAIALALIGLWRRATGRGLP